MPEESPLTKYWMVHCLGRGAPNVCHETRDSAAKEASRLAVANPSETFVVLAAVDAFETAIPVPHRIPIARPPKIRPEILAVVREVLGEDEDLPF